MPTTTRYKKLRNLLYNKIVSGKYVIGDRFFSQNELMKVYGLSLSTVNHALDELVREGYLRRETGKGTFVSSINPLAAEASVRKNVYLFTCTESRLKGCIDSASLYRQLEQKRYDDLSFTIIPHLAGPEDLDFFFFTKEPADMVVFLNALPQHTEFRKTISAQSHVIIVGNSIESAMYNNLSVDFTSTTAEAVAYLLAQGHRQIAMIYDKDSIEGQLFVEGYRSAIRAIETQMQEKLLIDVSQGINLNTILERLNDPDLRITAVLSMDTQNSYLIRSAVEFSGKRIPSDISLIYLEDETNPQFPDISAIQIPTVLLADRLIEMIRDPENVSITPIKSRFVLRHSIAPYNG